MNDTNDKIAKFLLTSQPQKSGGIEKILVSQDLFNDGWLDSLLSLKLLNFLEKEFSIHIPHFQVMKKNFLSVQAIQTLVEKNKGNTTS